MEPTDTGHYQNPLWKPGRIALLVAALSAVLLTAAGAADAITEEEAHAIGVDAYVYLYPLVTMDITRQQLTNVKASPGAIGGPPSKDREWNWLPAPEGPQSDDAAICAQGGCPDGQMEPAAGHQGQRRSRLGSAVTATKVEGSPDIAPVTTGARLRRRAEVGGISRWRLFALPPTDK